MDDQLFRGVTLLETLVVMSLFITLAGLGLFVSFSEYRGTYFRDERILIIGALQKARSQALGNQCRATGCTGAIAHGVYFGTSNTYIMYEGSSYDSRHETEDERVEGGDASIRLTGCRDIVFQPGSGDGACVNGESYVIIEESERTSTIRVSSAGRIWWDAP